MLDDDDASQGKSTGALPRPNKQPDRLLEHVHQVRLRSRSSGPKLIGSRAPSVVETIVLPSTSFCCVQVALGM